MDKPFALIVEDDRDIAALFRHVLDIAGYRTEVAMHGRDAVDRLKLGRPDITLLDLNLPGIPDGIPVFGSDQFVCADEAARRDPKQWRCSPR